jgi:hypothetical protein
MEKSLGSDEGSSSESVRSGSGESGAVLVSRDGGVGMVYDSSLPKPKRSKCRFSRSDGGEW